MHNCQHVDANFANHLATSFFLSFLFFFFGRVHPGCRCDIFVVHRLGVIDICVILIFSCSKEKVDYNKLRLKVQTRKRRINAPCLLLPCVDHMWLVYNTRNLLSSTEAGRSVRGGARTFVVYGGWHA